MCPEATIRNPDGTFPKGNPGWGGPPTGKTSAARIAGPGRPKGVKDGEGKKALARAAFEAALPAAVQTVVTIMQSVTDQRSLMAANSIIDRVLGKVGDKVTLAGDADAPLIIRRIIIDPKAPDGHPDATGVPTVPTA